VCGELIARGRGCSLMLLGTARPEFTPPWRSRAWLTTLSVGPLADDEIRAMIAALGDGRTLPDPVLDRVVGEADGIPLYAEEVGRTALEAGLAGEGDGSAVGIPTTLQGSLMARLDRLSAAKRVAQQAAVIGREFSYELLFEVAGLEEAVLRGGLDRLVETELVFQHGAPPRATYTFKHALIQDAAYQSLLKRTRRELHRRIAQALEARLDDEGKASPEAVARHYEAAEETAAAVANYRRAADLAAHQSAFLEAIAHYRRAIALLGELPEGPDRDEEEVDVQLGLGSSIIATRSYADPEIATAYERARELCEGLGDDAKVASALAGLSIYYLNRGQLDVGTELAERVLEVGDALGDDALQLLGHVQLALPFICRAAFAEAQQHARAAIEIYSPERHHGIAFRFGTDQGVAARCFEGWSLFGLGQLDRATDSMRSAVELARRLGHPFSTAYALLFETTMHWVRGDAEAQRESSQAVLAIAEEQGFEYWTGLGHVFLGNELALRTGDPAALPPIINGSMVAGATGNVLCSTPVLASVAEAQAAVGELNDAMGTLDGALAVSDQTGQPWWDAELHRLKAEMLLVAAGDEPDAATVGRAERRLEKALEIAREQDFPVHELRAATAQGRLLAARGEPERAIALVRPLYEAFDEGFAAAPLARARELLQELGVAVPPPGGADGGAPDQPSSKPSVA
jgi:predicted ATPase